MIGAKILLTDQWKAPGVFNVEEFNPYPFLEDLGKYGLPWHEEFDVGLEI